MNNDLTPGVPTSVSAESQGDAFLRSMQSVGEKLERWTLRRPLLASMTWMGVLFAISLTVHTPAFETNDDVVMSMIVSGTGASTQPDEHLVFSSFAIGLMLKQLYTQLPWVPWYGAYLVGIHYLCQVAVLYCLLKWRYSRAAVFCFLVLFGSVGVQLMSRLQFTSTAVWATECGIFLVLNGLALRRDGQRQSGVKLLGAGMALMILGSMVRFDSYIGAVAISAIPLTILIWLQDRATAPVQRLWRTALVVAVLTQVGAFGMQAAHHYYYSRDPAWQEYLAFNPYRVKFNDYCWTRYTEETKPVFDRVQWSENDHDMIRMCYFDDPQVFGRKNLQAIVEGFPWAQEAVSLQKMQRWWRGILSNVRLWPIWALILLQIWWARDRQFAIRHFVMLTLSLDAFICALMFLKNPPGRVYYPLIAFQALYTLYLMRYCGSSSDEKVEATEASQNEARNARLSGTPFHGFINVALCSIAILGICVGQHKAHRDSRTAVRANRRLHADLARVDPLESDLFVCWGASFPYESILPLESNQVLRRIHLLTLGWPQQSPINDAVKAQFGIRDLPQSLFDNPNVYLLGKGAELTYYRTYIREHYGTDVAWDLYFDGNEFGLFKPVKLDANQHVPSEPTPAVSSRWHESPR
ncbi:MAG: hypothetical protein JWP89_6059 [Schlesneria sp.]|nr:hypothetical protein [Schlesneria sp.]